MTEPKLRYSERALLDSCKRGEQLEPGKVLEVVRRLGRERQLREEAETERDKLRKVTMTEIQRAWTTGDWPTDLAAAIMGTAGEEVQRLEAERNKLREALEEIAAKWDPAALDRDWEGTAAELVRIARSALSQPQTPPETNSISGSGNVAK